MIHALYCYGMVATFYMGFATYRMNENIEKGFDSHRDAAWHDRLLLRLLSSLVVVLCGLMWPYFFLASQYDNCRIIYRKYLKSKRKRNNDRHE